MPYVNVKITPEGVTREQKARVVAERGVLKCRQVASDQRLLLRPCPTFELLLALQAKLARAVRFDPPQLQRTVLRSVG